MGISSQDVLEAAGTKWNFLKFKPGLVGGHCIGVDPYYLTYKAEKWAISQTLFCHRDKLIMVCQLMWLKKQFAYW